MDLGNEPRSCCWTIPAPTLQTQPGVTSRKARDTEVTTQCHLPAHPAEAAQEHLGCAEGEHHTRAKHGWD